MLHEAIRISVAACCLLTALIAPPPAAEANPPMDIGLISRQPQRPARAVDLTDALHAAVGDAASIEEAMALPTEPYAAVIARGRVAQRMPTPGQRTWWRVDVAAPDAADPAWPTVLEFDECRVVTEVWVGCRRG